VVYDDDARDSKEARGVVEQTLINVQLDKEVAEPKGIVSKPVIEPSIEPPMVRKYRDEKPDTKTSMIKTVSGDPKVDQTVVTKTTIIKQFDRSSPTKTVTTKEMSVSVSPDKKDVVSEKEKQSKEGKEIDEKSARGAISADTGVAQKITKTEIVTRVEQKKPEIKAPTDKDKEKDKDIGAKSAKASAYEDIYNVQHRADSVEEKSDEEGKKAKSTGIFSGIFKGSKLKRSKKGSKDTSFDSGDEEAKIVVTKTSEQQPDHPSDATMMNQHDISEKLADICTNVYVKRATMEFLHDCRRVAAGMHVPYEGAKPVESATKEEKRTEPTESDDDGKDKAGFFSSLFKSKSKKDEDGAAIPVIHVEKPKESTEQIAKKEKKRLAAVAKENELQMKEKEKEAESKITKIPSTIDKESEKTAKNGVKSIEDVKSKADEKDIVTMDEQSHDKDAEKEEDQIKEKSGFFGIFKSPKSKEKKMSKSKDTSVDSGDEEIKVATEKLLDDTRKATDISALPIAYKSDGTKIIPEEETRAFVSITSYDADVPADKIGKSYDVVQTKTTIVEKTIIRETLNGKADIDKEKDRKTETQDTEESICKVKSETPEQKASETEKETSDDSKEKSGGFFGMFKSPKLKSKKRSKSREQSSSKETSFDSGDEEIRLATTKLLEDTRQMAENLQHSPAEKITEQREIIVKSPIEHIKNEEIKKSIIPEEETTGKDKGGGIFGIFRSPKQARSSRSRSKEKTPSFELPDTCHEDLREITAKFLEDSQNVAVITGESTNIEQPKDKTQVETKPEKTDKLVTEAKKTEQQFVTEDVSKDDKDAVSKKIDEKSHDIVENAEATKDKASKEAKKAKEKGSGFLSGIFKGAKHAAEEVSDDVKDFLDETKKEAALEEARAKEAATANLKDIKEKKDSAVVSTKDIAEKTIADVKDSKDKTMSAMKEKKEKITDKISKDVEKAMDHTKATGDKIVTETKKVGEKMDTTATDAAQVGKELKEAITTGIKEDVKTVKEKISSATDSVTDSSASAKDKAAKEAKKVKEKGSGFFSGIFKSTKHAAEDMTDDVKEFLDKTEKEAALKEEQAKEKVAARMEDLKVAKDEAMSAIKDKEDKIVDDVSKDAQKITDTTKAAGEKVVTKTKEAGEKIETIATDVSEAAKSAKDATVKEVKEDAKLVKDKLAAGADAAAETVDSAKDKAAKEAKKAKEKTSGFFSGIFKGAKHAVEDATDDVKDFLGETKKEAELEEARAKEKIAAGVKDLKDKKDAIVTDVQDTAEKAVTDVKDAKDKTISDIKDKKDKITDKASKDAENRRCCAKY